MLIVRSEFTYSDYSWLLGLYWIALANWWTLIISLFSRSAMVRA